MMSATTSATTGRRYGFRAGVSDVGEVALYARRARAQCRKRGAGPARRGPTPALSDAQLLAAIRTDLARSPFQGEGPRKVHARLRILDGIRVSRTRVLRVMRAQGLLSPHRGRQGDPKAHDGTIVTSAPCVMWGTDGRRVFTAEDGWVWNLRGGGPLERRVRGLACVQGGEPFCRPRADRARARATLRLGRGGRGPRLGATDGPRQPVSVGPLPQPGPLLGHPPQLRLPRRAGNQRGRRARESHAQGASDLRPGLHNLAEVRAAVAAFVERYNQCWRLEKLAYRTPLEAREQYELRHAA